MTAPSWKKWPIRMSQSYSYAMVDIKSPAEAEEWRQKFRAVHDFALSLGLLPDYGGTSWNQNPESWPPEEGK